MESRRKAPTTTAVHHQISTLPAQQLLSQYEASRRTAAKARARNAARSSIVTGGRRGPAKPLYACPIRPNAIHTREQVTCRPLSQTCEQVPGARCRVCIAGAASKVVVSLPSMLGWIRVGGVGGKQDGRRKRGGAKAKSSEMSHFPRGRPTRCVPLKVASSAICGSPGHPCV